ncbi:hypothetical protein AVEN_165716-1 [Araneus ventricosus]|uniref:Uncharacterized protein n=1 Tax=Araneus ventricosus TaxID=182803 RepID=A0A4Y2C337_ARAVE|nr:hypothetical protein AVEN_165716-1 [Araneus ventricosus]
MASKPDPPTQASMAKALNVSQQVDRCRKFITTDEAWIYLSDTNAKVQYLSRDRRDLTPSTTVPHPKGLMVWMGISANGVIKPRRDRRDLTPSTTVPHPKGLMVWMGISANGVIKPRFVQPGAKINSVYYIQKILKPFLKDDYCRLYPNGDAVFIRILPIACI